MKEAEITKKAVGIVNYLFLLLIKCVIKRMPFYSRLYVCLFSITLFFSSHSQ